MQGGLLHFFLFMLNFSELVVHRIKLNNLINLFAKKNVIIKPLSKN